MTHRSLAVRLDAEGTGQKQRLLFTTNLDNRVSAGSAHPLMVEYRNPSGEPSPYIHIRGGLRALLSRTVFLELIELGEAASGQRRPRLWCMERGQVLQPWPVGRRELEARTVGAPFTTVVAAYRRTAAIVHSGLVDSPDQMADRSTRPVVATAIRNTTGTVACPSAAAATLRSDPGNGTTRRCLAHSPTPPHH